MPITKVDLVEVHLISDINNELGGEHQSPLANESTKGDMFTYSGLC